MEPYGKGVVAFAVFEGNLVGRNIVSQVTAYCRRGTPYLLLSQSKPSGAFGGAWVKAAYEMLDGFSVWSPSGGRSVRYPPSNVDFRIGGEPVAELRLDARGANMLIEGAGVSVGLPSVIGPSFDVEVRPTDADAGLLRGAFSLCIE
jgi:hypothetical protein